MMLLGARNTARTSHAYSHVYLLHWEAKQEPYDRLVAVKEIENIRRSLKSPQLI